MQLLVKAVLNSDAHIKSLKLRLFSGGKIATCVYYDTRDIIEHK